MKKTPLTKEEHLKFRDELFQAIALLGPWMNRFYEAYSVNGKECNELHKVLHFLSVRICFSQNNHYDKLLDYTEDRKSEKDIYFGPKKAGSWC